MTGSIAACENEVGNALDKEKSWTEESIKVNTGQKLRVNPRNRLMYDARYSMGFCYEELGEYDKAYDMWLGIAHDLEKEGYEVEKKFPLELAEKCRKILEKGLRQLP